MLGLWSGKLCVHLKWFTESHPLISELFPSTQITYLMFKLMITVPRLLLNHLFGCFQLFNFGQWTRWLDLILRIALRTLCAVRLGQETEVFLVDTTGDTSRLWINTPLGMAHNQTLQKVVTKKVNLNHFLKNSTYSFNFAARCLGLSLCLFTMFGSDPRHRSRRVTCKLLLETAMCSAVFPLSSWVFMSQPYELIVMIIPMSPRLVNKCNAACPALFLAFKSSSSRRKFKTPIKGNL